MVGHKVDGHPVAGLVSGQSPSLLEAMQGSVGEVPGRILDGDEIVPTLREEGLEGELDGFMTGCRDVPDTVHVVVIPEAARVGLHNLSRSTGTELLVAAGMASSTSSGSVIGVTRAAPALERAGSVHAASIRAAVVSAEPALVNVPATAASVTAPVS
jgi:hypothetical protein